MIGLVIAGCAGAMLALYAVDRGVKARIRARRRRVMSDRLTAATVRADEQQASRRAAVRASKELTSVMPAIKRPPLVVPGKRARPTGRERPGQPGRGSAHPGRRSSRTGEHAAHSPNGAREADR